MGGVDVVIHAAALKQVLTGQFDASEAVQTNILGSQNVVDAAIDRGVSKVLLISTDKAVYPISLYGASKLAAEKLFVSANAYTRNGGTRLACARYGNVLGSRGSVAPLFLRQRALGTLTVTDPAMTRFMMTMEQGVRFVIRCVELMQGGEVFVPKVPSMRVMDLAKAIAPNARIKTIGRRVGEKIHEVLLTDDEIPRTRLYRDECFVVAADRNGYSKGVWADGKPLPDGFAYTSDRPDQWLSVAELRKMVEADES
jgi:FlaA1/EpsC-like NDP-sugar epimerase